MIRILLTLLLVFSFPVRAAELKIATWNLAWLTDRPAGDLALPRDVRPKRAEDILLLRHYAERLDADVLAIQEVDGADIVARVFPADRYAIHLTADRVVQRTGFAVRRTIPFTVNPDVTSLALDPQAGHPLRSGADITLRPAGSLLRLLSVHLKAGCRQEPLTRSPRPQCEILRAQLAPLQGWIAERVREQASFVILGDFNRAMDTTEHFLAGMQQAAPLTRAAEGKSNPCWGGAAFIDQILAGGAARGWMQPGSLRVMTYRESGPEWRERLSDHCPVSVRFQLPG